MLFVSYIVHLVQTHLHLLCFLHGDTDDGEPAEDGGEEREEEEEARGEGDTSGTPTADTPQPPMKCIDSLRTVRVAGRRRGPRFRNGPLAGCPVREKLGTR